MKVLAPKAILHLSIRIDMRYLSRRYLPMKKMGSLQPMPSA
jgi:hypothetical protein